jgi:hypothetical protein
MGASRRGAIRVRAWLAALLGAALLAAVPLGTVRDGASAARSETLTVPFSLGTAGAWTRNAYAGAITVTVSGSGQAAGSQSTDAFYVFTDGAGNPVAPWHPTEFYNWSLWINGGPADTYVQPIPAYRADHTYTVRILAPGGRIAFGFGVGDAYVADNAGAYTVTVVQGWGS